MSRSYRGREFIPRWGLWSFVKPKEDKEAQVAYLNRVVKRANKAAGYDSAKKPHEWIWRYNEFRVSGKVVALTRSEARALVKEKLGVSKNKRLPEGVTITKGNLADV